MKKKHVIWIVVLAAVIALGAWGIHSGMPKTYSSAKKQCVRLLRWYKGDMERAAEWTYTQTPTGSNYTSGKCRGMYYVRYLSDQTVRFDVGGQGMLGGQHWHLVYTPDGTLYGQDEVYEYRETDGGNNITKAEKIDENWWFLWVDFDGTKYSDE